MPDRTDAITIAPAITVNPSLPDRIEAVSDRLSNAMEGLGELFGQVSMLMHEYDTICSQFHDEVDPKDINTLLTNCGVDLPQLVTMVEILRGWTDHLVDAPTDCTVPGCAPCRRPPSGPIIPGADVSAEPLTDEVSQAEPIPAGFDSLVPLVPAGMRADACSVAAEVQAITNGMRAVIERAQEVAETTLTVSDQLHAVFQSSGLRDSLDVRSADSVGQFFDIITGRAAVASALVDLSELAAIH